MKQFVLVNDGIFPITRNSRGDKLSQGPATGFAFPGTIQGEGKLAGIPSLFIRLAGCNLRCMWFTPDGSVNVCDTPYSSFSLTGSRTMLVTEAVNTVLENLEHMNHVVITGGEPMLQADALAEFCALLKQERPTIHLTLETNGTIFNAAVARQIDLFSISPKLSDALPDDQKIAGLDDERFGKVPEIAKTTKVKPEIIQQFIDFCRLSFQKELQLKLVLANESSACLAEDELLNQLTGFAPHEIIAMPLGSTPETLAQSTPGVIEAAIKRGWRFTPRLHINLFGDKEGV